MRISNILLIFSSAGGLDCLFKNPKCTLKNQEHYKRADNRAVPRKQADGTVDDKQMLSLILDIGKASVFDDFEIQ